MDCQNRYFMVEEMFDRAEIDPAWNRIYSEFVPDEMFIQAEKDEIDRNM